MIILVLSNIWFQPLLKWERSWQWAWSVEKRNRQILLRWRWRWRMLTLMTLSKLRKKSWFQIGILLGSRLQSKLIVSMSGHHTSGEVTQLFPNEHFIDATFYLSIHNIIPRVLIVCKPQGNGWTLIPLSQFKFWLFVNWSGHSGSTAATVQGGTPKLDDHISLHPGKQDISDPPFMNWE